MMNFPLKFILLLLFFWKPNTAKSNTRDTTVKNDWKRDELKGKVKQIVHYNDTGGVIKKVSYNPMGYQISVWEPCEGNTKKLCLTDSSIYNEEGTQVAQRVFKSFTIKYSYDDQGNLTEIDRRPTSSTNRSEITTYTYKNGDRVKINQMSYALDGITMMSGQVSEYRYNDKHQVIELLSAPVTKRPGKQIIYQYRYDDRGNLVYQCQLNEEGQKFSEHLYTYDAQNKKIQYAFRSPKGDANYTELFSYDDRGRQTENKHLLADGSVLRRSSYTFDDLKNEIHGDHYKGDLLVQHTIQLLNKDGLVVEERTLEQGNLIRKRILLRDSTGNIISRVQTDKNGKILFKREFEITYY